MATTTAAPTYPRCIQACCADLHKNDDRALGDRRIYYRDGRFYADWRTQYGAIGIKREALKIPGTTRGATCLGWAVQLYDERKRELQTKLDLAMQRALTTREPLAAVPTVDDLAKRYIEVVGDELKRTTPRNGPAQNRVRRTLARALDSDAFRNIEYADQVTDLVFGALLAELGKITVKRDGEIRPIKAGTVYRMGRVLVGWMTWCTRNKFVATNPWRAHPAMARLRKEIDDDEFEGIALSAEQCCRLLDWLKATEPDRAKTNPHLLPLVATLLYTGMRWSEAAGLLVKDVSLRGNGKVIHVRKHPHRRLKNKYSDRRIRIQPALLPYLIPLLRGRPADGLVFPAPPRFAGHTKLDDEGKPKKESDPMPKTKLGERMYRKIDTGLAMTCRDAGVPEVRCHDLRHTYASIRAGMVEKDAIGQMVPVNSLKLAKEMGHTDVEMLIETYYHEGRIVYGLADLDYSLARDVERQLDERLSTESIEQGLPVPEIKPLGDPPGLANPPFKGRGLLRVRLYQAYMAGVAAAANQGDQRMKVDAGTAVGSREPRVPDPDAMPDELPPELLALVPDRLATRGAERGRLLHKLWMSFAVGLTGRPWLIAVARPRLSGRAAARARREARAAAAAGASAGGT